MVRRVSWCTLVALVVLFFVTAEGLRERNTQIENHKTTNRGSLRFNSKSLEDSTTASSPLTRSKLTRDRSAQLKRFSSFSKPNDVSTLASVIDLASNFDSNRQPNVRTTRTTERGNLSDVKTDSGRATSEKKPVEPNKDLDPTVNRRNGKRYEVNEGPNSKTNEPKVPLDAFKGVPRRTFNGRVSPTWGTNHGPTERLDNKGPSVFLATTESSRSRTGRKIQTTYSMKDLKTQIPTSRRYTKKFEDLETTTLSFRRDGRGRSTTEKIERSTRSGRSKLASRENNYITRRGPDPLLTESESVRVDIPLEVGATETPLSDATTAFSVISQRRSDTKDSSRSNTRTGPKNRARSSDSEAAGSSRSGSRRGSSKFSDSTTTEADEQIVSSRKNAVPRDRSRGADAKKNNVVESRARSRGRNLENNVKPVSSGSYERDGKRKVIGERNPSDRRTRILDGSLRSVENRGQDSQDTRARSRNRSRSETTTPTTTDVTSTVAPDTTVSNDVTTVDPEPTSTTIGPATPATPASTTSSPRTTTRPSVSTTTSTTESPGRPRGRGRGNQGRKQKEDFFNHGLGFRGRKPSLEGSSNVSDARRFIPSKNDSYGNPGWTLRRRPAHVNSSENTSRMVATTPRDQTNEVIPPNEQSTSTEASTTVESSTRRGFKKPQSSEETSTVAGGTTKSSRRGNKTFGFGKSEESEESDNYPPEFKARLTQLKNLSTKIPAPKTTSRSPLEVKKSSAGLFAERSRMKLELARRLVKPELNIEENDLDATTASSFSKPKPNGVPVVDQASIIAKYPNPAATGRRSPSSVENTRDEASVKPAKLADPRTGLEEYSPKVTGSRPYNLKKGRIIAERMVTSISIEEKPAVEDTTRPYVLSTNPSVIASAEESSATTIDSARIRVNNRGGKKSKEEDSPPWKHAKVSLYSTQTVENNDPVTTATPKKSYAYQSRNGKSQEQATTIEQNPTTSVPKKSYASTQRKLQTSHEEAFGKKSKLANSATKTTFRPRYSKRTKQKSVEEKTIDYQVSVTTKMPIATSRYSRKKSAVKASEEKSKSVTSQGISTQTRKTEFRPRTATYRRHSDVLTTSVESTTRAEGTGVAITPRSSKYHATLKTSTEPTRSVAQEPQVNLRIANESTPETPETPGITGSSNGDSGNTNIFNPTRSTFLSGNNTLLEQLRSTVAPLLSSLGNKTPVFSGAYSNVNTANSPPRITPNGQPPRFSARYKGAELFVRKQNNIYQPTVPSITSSSTTPVTPVESNALLNTQMGTTSVTPIVSTGRPPTDSQGGRIVQDRERDEATRTKEAEGQRSSVYIGQDKFVNYWTDGASTSNPRVLSVNINSVASGANEGPSPSLPTFENLLNNQRRGQVTAPPGFPWRDPLEQIFGITTSSPVISASVASNTLDDTSEPNGPVLARPINPFVEVFTPFSSVIGVPRGNVGTIPPPPSSTTPVSMATNATMSTTTPASSTSTTTTAPTTTTTTTTTMAPTTTTTTTMAPTTTTTTTMAPTTTTTTTMAPTTTTTTTITTTTAPTTTTMAPTTTTTQSTTTAQRANLVSQVGSTSGTTASQTNSFNVPKSLFSPQQQNAFGTTFDDLAFLNSLLQSNSRSTTQKTLTQVEQLLANKILALALNNPGPTRAPKAIDVDNVSSNSIFEPVTKSPSQPIVIDLSPSSTTSLPTWSSVETQQLTSQKPIINSTPDRVTWKPVTTTSSKKDIELNTISTSSGDKFTLISTTKGPVNVKGRTVTTPRPRTTSPAPLGIAGFLWQTLLGGSLYRTSTTPKPVKAKPVPKTTPKSVNITPKPIQPSVPSKTVDILKIRVNTPNSEMKDIVSTTKQPLLNNPNPRLPNVVTSTYSPEEDAKFLVELLRAVEQDNKVSDSRKTAELTLKDDESVLRAVLSGRTYTTTTPPSTTEMSNAALLAALLKARGIEPSTPSTKIREQLLSASLGQSVTSAPASEAATITTRQASTLARAVDSVKKTATPRSISATTKTRTTTWSPSSTYPPPLFSSFSNFGNPGQSANGDNSRNSALFGATRAFSQFLGAAISGAAQQLQSLVRNGTKIVSDVVG